jgi:hypothetical protein
MELRAVDKTDVSTAREVDRLVSEAPRRDHEATRSASRRHDSVEFPNDVHADLQGTPLLALDQKLLVAVLRRSGQNEIDSSVGATSARFRDLIALQSKTLANEHLELLPAHSIEDAGGLALRNIEDEVLPAPAPPGRRCGTREAQHRQNELADGCKAPPHRLSDHRPDLARLNRGGHLLRRYAMKNYVAKNG